MTKSKKIFVGSMTDLFGEWVPDWMIFALLDAMAAAHRQTFQILTKRPERASETISAWLRHVGREQLPPNVWLGVSAENQATYNERVRWLSRCLAQVRFLSLEPLLDFIELAGPGKPIPPIDWVIVGGESGPNARPLDLDWISGILAQCKCYEIPVFIKQLGTHWAKTVGANHSKGGDPDDWSAFLRVMMSFRVRMFPGEEWV
jgi:protein gp37